MLVHFQQAGPGPRLKAVEISLNGTSMETWDSTTDGVDYWRLHTLKPDLLRRGENVVTARASAGSVEMERCVLQAVDIRMTYRVSKERP